MVEQYLVTSWIIFSWLLLALQVKVGKVASFVGELFVARASTTKTANFYPTKVTCYYDILLYNYLHKIMLDTITPA